MPKYWNKVILAVIALTLVALAPCGTNTPPEPTPSTSPTQLTPIQQSGNMTARLFGLMTFRSPDTTVMSPSEFAVPAISIEWMGPVFSGQLDETDSGSNVTYQVHGKASADGLWLDSAFFSRQTINPATNTGSFYRVTLRNVPMGKLTDGVSDGQLTFEKEGSEIQKFVDRIEYGEGPVNGGKITATTTYLSTDWKNSLNGQIPSLKLSLASGPGKERNPDFRDLVRQSSRLAARLYVLMIFDFGGTPISFPSVFEVPPVPISWSGSAFGGKVEKAGPGSDLDFEVAGKLSADGGRLESLAFSQTIQANPTGSFRVTLRNVPLGKLAAGSVTGPGSFEESGAGIEQYVDSIEYPAVTGYVFDWENTLSGQAPTLTLTFGRESGEGNAAPTTTQPSGMGR